MANTKNSLLKGFHITSVSRADIAQMLMDTGADEKRAEKMALKLTDIETLNKLCDLEREIGRLDS